MKRESLKAKGRQSDNDWGQKKERTRPAASPKHELLLHRVHASALLRMNFCFLMILSIHVNMTRDEQHSSDDAS